MTGTFADFFKAESRAEASLRKPRIRRDVISLLILLHIRLGHLKDQMQKDPVHACVGDIAALVLCTKLCERGKMISVLYYAVCNLRCHIIDIF